MRARTPARLLVGRAGASYRTDTQLDLRAAHASARDAVQKELDLEKDLGRSFVREFGLFEVSTQAGDKEAYLHCPDLGRTFTTLSRSTLLKLCPTNPDLQIVLADGLSVAAVASQGPKLYRALCEQAKQRGWRLGQGFVIRHCRVGILNDIGELLHPKVAVLLIGERPGLATAESLSAYMAYEPDKTQTDANRNLISNIHSRGVGVKEAALRVLNFASRMMASRTSGYQLSEENLASPGQLSE